MKRREQAFSPLLQPIFKCGMAGLTVLNSPCFTGLGYAQHYFLPAGYQQEWAMPILP
jgi:hypothetical protein